MATGNFHFHNRCVVVTNEDIEDSNLPQEGEFYEDSLRSYPAWKIAEYEDAFLTHDIVICSGYYEGACIDYREKDFLGGYDFSVENFDNVKMDILDECSKLNPDKEELFRLVWNLCSAVGKDRRFHADELFGYIYGLEKENINESINKIKDDYGYEELAVFAVLGNGETMYKKIK